MDRTAAYKYLIILLWIISFSCLNVIAKKIAANPPPLSLGISKITLYMIKSGWLYILCFLYLLCAVLYLSALHLMPLSSAGPGFLIIGSIITTVMGAVFFGEPLSLIKMAGLVICVIGILLMI